MDQSARENTTWLLVISIEGISMSFIITWQQRNIILNIEINHQDHSMQHNLIKITSNGRINYIPLRFKPKLQRLQ